MRFGILMGGLTLGAEMLIQPFPDIEAFEEDPYILLCYVVSASYYQFI